MLGMAEVFVLLLGEIDLSSATAPASARVITVLAAGAADPPLVARDPGRPGRPAPSSAAVEGLLDHPARPAVLRGHAGRPAAACRAC